MREKLEADQRVKEEAERRVKEDLDRRAKIQAEAQARVEGERRRLQEEERKRREEARNERAGTKEPSGRSRSSGLDLGPRLEKAFRRDPDATLRSLEEALARLGYQIRPLAPLRPTNSSGAEGAA